VAGNQALARVLESLMASYDQEQRHILALYGERDTDQQAHREILAAVCGRRAVRARRLMREHLHDVRTVVSAALGVPDLR
jgi:DNA-binding FadR family transcriptional regulator